MKFWRKKNVRMTNRLYELSTWAGRLLPIWSIGLFGPCRSSGLTRVHSCTRVTDGADVKYTGDVYNQRHLYTMSGCWRRTSPRFCEWKRLIWAPTFARRLPLDVQSSDNDIGTECDSESRPPRSFGVRGSAARRMIYKFDRIFYSSSYMMSRMTSTIIRDVIAVIFVDRNVLISDVDVKLTSSIFESRSS